MRAKKAVEHFIGREGTERLNCAQSVAAVFADEGGFTEKEFAELAGYGYGGAPQGCCGSAYAAMAILAKVGADKVEQFKNDFNAYALSLNCKEIREMKKISCVRSVKKAAELVDSLLRKGA